jgi:hypothetical protein
LESKFGFWFTSFVSGPVIGKALGIGTGTVQRVLMEQPRPFDVGVAEAALASKVKQTGGM